ncbi:unnamed protein product, partial [marine sediment metagenome]
LKAYKDQKLFIYNAGHAILAYLGYQKKYRYIWQAIADNEIRKVFLGALEEAGNALMKKYQFEPQEFHSFGITQIKPKGFSLKFKNPCASFGEISIASPM